MPRTNTPAPAVTGDVLRAIFYSRTANVVCLTTHDYMYADSLPDVRARMVSFLDIFSQDLVGPYAQCLSTATVIEYVECVCLTDLTVAPISKVIAVGGQQDSEPLPLVLAATCARTSHLRGQHGRGRWSMPAVPQLFVNLGVTPTD